MNNSTIPGKSFVRYPIHSLLITVRIEIQEEEKEQKEERCCQSRS